MNRTTTRIAMADKILFFIPHTSSFSFSPVNAVPKQPVLKHLECHTLQKLADEHCRIAHDSHAFQNRITLIITPGLFPVFPVYPGDLPAEDTSMVFGYFLLESLQNFMGIGPHLRVIPL